MVSDSRIISPPIVGVPRLVSRWEAGPSSRIGCPLPCFDRSQSIIRGPMTKPMNSAVIIAAPERKLR